MSMMLRGGC